MAIGWERAAEAIDRARPGDVLSLLVRVGPDDDGAAAFERVDGEVVDRARYQGVFELRVEGAAPYVVVRPAPTVPAVTVRRVPDGDDVAWNGPWEQVGIAEALAVDDSGRRSWAADPDAGSSIDADSALIPDDLGESAD